MTTDKLTQEQVMAAIQSDDYIGFCIDCGAEAHNVEPDARKYKCEACGNMSVFGAEEILLSVTFLKATGA